MRTAFPILLAALCVSCATHTPIGDPVRAQDDIPQTMWEANLVPPASPAPVEADVNSSTCLTRWGKPCVNTPNLYTGYARLAWSEAAAVFVYRVLTSTNLRTPIAQWALLTNTTGTSVPVALVDGQRFFCVNWSNTISHSVGFISP